MKKIDDTKFISLGAFVVATIILFIVAWRDSSSLTELYFFYCFAFAGLTVSKGIVTTFQKRDELTNSRKQNYEHNSDIERDFDLVVKHSGSQSEAEKDRTGTGRSNT